MSGKLIEPKEERVRNGFQRLLVKNRGDSMSNIIQLTKKGKQMAHNVKQNLSIPVVQSKQEDNALAIRYEKRVYRLIRINMVLFSLFLIGWKYWFQYRNHYTYNQSLDYMFDVFPFLETLVILFVLSIILGIYFDSLMFRLQDGRDVSTIRYSLSYWLASISMVFFCSFCLSVISTKILIIAAVLTLCIVMTIKYIAPYVYEKYGYSFTYFQIAVYFQSLSILLFIIFDEGIIGIIMNIICIIVDIVMLLLLYQGLEHDKTQFNNGEYKEEDIIIYAYENSLLISLEILSLFTNIARLLSGYAKSNR